MLVIHMNDKVRKRIENDIMLSKRISSGDDAARWELVMSNYKSIRHMVAPIALRFKQDIDDITNEALIYAYKRSKDYDVRSFTSFTSYIRNSLISYIAYTVKNESYTFYIPRGVDYYAKAFRAGKELKGNTRYCEATISKIERMMQGVQRDQLLNESDIHGKDVPKEYVYENDLIQQICIKETVNNLTELLTSRGKEYINMFFGLDGNPPMAVHKIAKAKNVHHSYVSKVIKKSIEKMKELA